MLETLKARKEALEAQGKKGFTLMEMLIIIAIIAILIAIAIPIFTSQLENARQGTDAANLRSAYATVTAKAMTDNNSFETSVSMEHTQSWNDNFKNQTIGTTKLEDANATTNLYVYATPTGETGVSTATQGYDSINYLNGTGN